MVMIASIAISRIPENFASEARSAAIEAEPLDMIKAYWKKQPEQAPNQQLLTEALDAVTAGRALTEPQAQEIFTYIEPKFHSAPA